MSSIKRLRFTTSIAAPTDTVFKMMIDPQSFKKWTTAFMEGSYFEGSWEQEQKIRFLTPSGNGIVAEIAEHKANHFISIRHLGYVVGGVDDTESESVSAWAPAYENYTFQESSTGTTLIVEQDVTDEFEACMTEAWPRALDALKTICEVECKA
jgi:uncharacterized protein YndB with AHSA1/START domain